MDNIVKDCLGIISAIVLSKDVAGLDEALSQDDS